MPPPGQIQYSSRDILRSSAPKANEVTGFSGRVVARQIAVIVALVGLRIAESLSPQYQVKSKRSNQDHTPGINASLIQLAPPVSLIRPFSLFFQDSGKALSFGPISGPRNKLQRKNHSALEEGPPGQVFNFPDHPIVPFLGYAAL